MPAKTGGGAGTAPEEEKVAPPPTYDEYLASQTYATEPTGGNDHIYYTNQNDAGQTYYGVGAAQEPTPVEKSYASEPTGGNDTIEPTTYSSGSGPWSGYYNGWSVSDSKLNPSVQEPMGGNDTLWTTADVDWRKGGFKRTIRDGSYELPADDSGLMLYAVQQGKGVIGGSTARQPVPAHVPGSTLPGRYPGDPNYTDPRTYKESLPNPALEKYEKQGRPRPVGYQPSNFGDWYNYQRNTTATEPEGDDFEIYNYATRKREGLPSNIQDPSTKAYPENVARQQAQQAYDQKKHDTPISEELLPQMQQGQDARTTIGLGGLFGGTNPRTSSRSISPRAKPDPYIRALPGGSPGTSQPQSFWNWVTRK